jgi:integrase
LEEIERRPTPPHLRRTCASIPPALWEPMPSVIRLLGHTDPRLTLRMYAHDMARREDEREDLKAPVEGREWGMSGDSPPVTEQNDALPCRS